MSHLTGADRARYVRDMFGSIAGRYDLMNRLMTFGRDNAWRRFVVEQASLQPGDVLLDLAAGTGDIAFAALQRLDNLTVVGLDFALPMMQVGRARRLGAHVRWCQGDAMLLPFADNTFAAVTSGYLLRNVIDLAQCLREQVRVVHPGGMVVALDTVPPPSSVLRPFINIYLRFVIPTLGRLVTGSPDAYEYLPSSTQAFKTPHQITGMMADAGLVGIGYRSFMFGTMAVYWGRKPNARLG